MVRKLFQLNKLALHDCKIGFKIHSTIIRNFFQLNQLNTFGLDKNYQQFFCTIVVSPKDKNYGEFIKTRTFTILTGPECGGLHWVRIQIH